MRVSASTSLKSVRSCKFWCAKFAQGWIWKKQPSDSPLLYTRCRIPFSNSRQLEKYQEHPVLLDPLLSKLISPLCSDLVQVFTKHDNDVTSEQFELTDQVCQVLYIISKVRGWKKCGTVWCSLRGRLFTSASYLFSSWSNFACPPSFLCGTNNW